MRGHSIGFICRRLTLQTTGDRAEFDIKPPHVELPYSSILYSIPVPEALTTEASQYS